MKPVLKYPGSKRLPALRVVELLGQNGPPDVYLEPFLGSGAVFFEAQRCWGTSVHYELSDACYPLISLWRALRGNPLGVSEALSTILSQDVTEDYYLRQRVLFNTGEGGLLWRAARALWLNKACFNGLWRFNKYGMFNVPWNKRPTVGGLPTASDLLEVSEALKGVGLGLDSWVTALKGVELWPLAGHKVAIYLDPPYAPSDKTAAKKAFVSYGAPGPAWTFADTITLVERCEQLAKSGGVRVVLSYMDDPLLVPVLQTGGWNVEYPTMPRTISRNGDGRKPVREILASLG